MFLKDDLPQMLLRNNRFTGVILLASNSRDYLKDSAYNLAKTILNLDASAEKANLRIFNTEKNYSLETVEEFILFERKKPVSRIAKAIILHDAELLGRFADKLLKVIEEPNEDSLIILTSTNPYAVIPTIRSRSFIFSEEIDETSYFVTAKEKFLPFLNSTNIPTEEDVQNIINLGVNNVIQAMFYNLSSPKHLEIAKNALAMTQSSFKLENVILYILYSFYLLNKEGAV